MPRRVGYGPGVPCWIDTITPDLTGTQRFYAALFGWEYADEDGYLLIRLGDEVVGGLGVAPPGRVTPAFWSTYLATTNLDLTLRLAAVLGGRTVIPARNAGADGRLALALDPVGAGVGFWEGHRPESIVLVDEPGALCWHTLTTPDRDASVAFYGALYPDALSATDDALVARGAAYADLVTSPVPQWIPTFLSADVAATLAVARGLGATADGATVTDPFGATFSLRAA